MDGLRISTGTYFKAWVIFVIVSYISAFLLGAVAGGIMGSIMGGLGMPLDQIKQYASILGAILSLPVSYIVFKWSVGKYIVQPAPPELFDLNSPDAEQVQEPGAIL